MNYREQILNHQRERKNCEWDLDSHLVPWARTWRETAGQPLAERWAAVGAARLADLRFLHDPSEPLIGRVQALPHDAAEIASARAYLEKEGLWTPGQTGHAEPFYDELFHLGLEKLRERAASMPACAKAAAGISAMIELAAECAATQEIADLCRRIARRPPETFQEAIQLIWFVMLAIQSGDRAVLVGPGRLDRRLIRFYEADLAAGRLSRQQALELIETLYFFINDYCGRGLAYAVMIGGRTPEGNDATNELSFLCLEALRRTRLVYPSVGLCQHADTPDSLKRLAVELICDGFSNVAVFNDELIRGSLVARGVPPAEAVEYINSTCVEITPCGSSNVYVASPYFPLGTILLEYLATSKDDSYEAFRSGCLDLIDRRIATAAGEQNAVRRERFRKQRRPIQSLFTRDCLSRGLDIEEGGARYNWVECSFVGLANFVDSLTVIRREVFEEKNLTLEQLREILGRDFAGDEPLRQRFLNAHPKYGNGDQEVDRELPQVTEFLAASCAKHRMFPDDSPFIPGTFCWEMHQRLGAECGATPDGRRAGMPFADGAGPAQGREKHGPTAAINSVCSWNHAPMLGGSAFNQRYTAATVATPEARQRLGQLIDTFIQFGGFETQINILDGATLEAARQRPDDYRDLVVRIGGYTDYFTGLPDAMQQELIMRTIYNEL